MMGYAAKSVSCASYDMSMD